MVSAYGGATSNVTPRATTLLDRGPDIAKGAVHLRRRLPLQPCRHHRAQHRALRREGSVPALPRDARPDRAHRRLASALDRLSDPFRSRGRHDQGRRGRRIEGPYGPAGSTLSRRHPGAAGQAGERRQDGDPSGRGIRPACRHGGSAGTGRSSRFGDRRPRPARFLPRSRPGDSGAAGRSQGRGRRSRPRGIHRGRCPILRAGSALRHVSPLRDRVASPFAGGERSRHRHRRDRTGGQAAARLERADGVRRAGLPAGPGAGGHARRTFRRHLHTHRAGRRGHGRSPDPPAKGVVGPVAVAAIRASPARPRDMHRRRCRAPGAASPSPRTCAG